MRSVEETVRIEGGQVLATLIRLTGDFQLAEDALQDAVVAALETWREKDIPSNPGAWLTTVGRNRALDRIRRESHREVKEIEAVRLLDEQAPVDGDDRLRLVFTCCHPALSQESQVALTLRTISGLTTTEIARAFLVAESTMGQRISRAKRKIAVARIPYRVPEDHELPDRLDAVLAVIYVIFTVGHHAPVGPLDARIDLAEESIRLARLLFGLMPDEPEIAGLLALMVAADARRATRLDAEGNMVLLADQDRSAWDHDAIAEASRLVENALGRGAAGRYQIEAAIACLHGEAASYADTDWPQIVQLYRMLERHVPTAVVRVNRAIAESRVHGPEEGLRLLADVDGLEGWHLYWSTRAEFLRESDPSASAAAYRRALTCEMNESDRRFLETRLQSVTPGPPDA